MEIGFSTALVASVLIVALCIGFNRYQWRKAWEAYYKRPQPSTHKDPNGKSSMEDERC